MGHPVHLHELLKGVEHWNAWRQEQGPNFSPDLRGFDVVREAQKNKSTVLIEENGETRLSLSNVDLRSAVLDDVNLRGANLVRAKLQGAELRVAKLEGVDLRRSELHSSMFRGAKLNNADMRGAKFSGGDLRGADLEGVDVRTERWPRDATGADIQGFNTDLSALIELSQSQLDGMFGDERTIIPEHLERPPHWGTFRETEKEDGDSAQAPSMSRQVAFLLSVPEPAVASTIYVADLIDSAVSEAHAKSGQNRSDEGDAFLAVARHFRALGAAIEQSASSAVDHKTKIAELEATIEAQMLEIDRLLNLLKSAKRTFTRDLIVGVLSSAGGAALYGGVGYLFGPEGANLIQYFWSILDPPAPPSPGPLPTTTAT